MIVDAHLHVWDTSKVNISWLAEAGLPMATSVPDVPSGRQYILVEADADDPAREVDWLAAVSARDSRVHGVVACVSLETAGAAAELQQVAAIPQVVGVRRLLQDRDLFKSSALVSGLQHLGEHGMPFDACVRASELPQLIRLLERVPSLTVVLDHMGKPNPGDPRAMREWRRDIARLAELPNVHCKLSGLPAECRDAHELEAVAADIIATVMESFGAKRCLLGSDQPVSQDVRDWCTRVLSVLPDTVQPAVAYVNALQIYSRRQ